MPVFESPSDLSEYLFRIVDNGGASADRYTVAFTNGSYLALSRAPSHPLGISQWGEDIDPKAMEEWVEEGQAVDLALGDLPPGLVQHILSRNNQGFDDFLESVERKDPKVVAPNRDAAKVNEGLRNSFGDGLYDSPDGYRLRLDGEPEEDRGPFPTARQAVLASLPNHYSFSGPEYHSKVDDLLRLEPGQEVSQKLAELEARVEAEKAPSPRM